ncbi:MAG: UDP-glucose 4-epimerase GalE [Treponema sp.]|jgi:UDP-glucose 4-epimerase|nr:UDP-glucose 4-epimerase GalE [Treponema sp.]
MRNILVTGGAGYIGSHIVKDLCDNDYHVIVYDNLSEGHREAVSRGDFISGDINDSNTLNSVFEKFKIDAVMHFAAYAYVGESVINPEKYYKNNVVATINLLSSMLKYKIGNIIFSSSCTTYGIPQYTPIDEKHPQNPISPYGSSKLMVERIIDDYHKAYGLRYMILRYFNAAGAHPDGTIGECHKTETHLIPLVLKTLTGERESIDIFGDDYETPDGTCVRDYIHVCDLAAAHRISLEMLFSGKESKAVNLGNGIGYSVKEIISLCEKITGKKVRFGISDRRPGDPPFLTASGNYKKDLPGFEPQYDINAIIKTAWEWERNKKY